LSAPASSPQDGRPGDDALVSVLVPSFNTCDLTLSALDAVLENAGCPIEIIVIDNASTDGSVAAIRAKFPDVTVLENDVNRGFGSAINQGAALAHGAYHLWLNTDAFVSAGAVLELRERARSADRLACVGPQLVFADGSPQMSISDAPSSAHSIRLLVNSLSHRQTSPHQWLHPDTFRVGDGRFVSGTCLLVNAAAWRDVGPLDEDFFFYCEEADWEHRARARGWQLAVVPDVKVTHLGGASGSATRDMLSLSAEQGSDLFVLKHEGMRGLLVRRLVSVVYLTVAYVRFVIQREHSDAGREHRTFVRSVLAGRVRQLVRNPRVVTARVS